MFSNGIENSLSKPPTKQQKIKFLKRFHVKQLHINKLQIIMPAKQLNINKLQIIMIKS